LTGSRQSLRVVPQESFGSRLRRQRRADDLTQAKLGAKFGVSQQTIGAWERGERPQNRFLGALANYLSLDEQELASLIDQSELSPKQDTRGVAADEPADSDDAMIRLLTRRFVADQEKGSIPSEAADIYRKLIDYYTGHTDVQ
jgi:transcriptional regulator with XRE-family HTH domain